jgi:3-phenylpropionate/cinnamic acid dioxygenase small subunit
MQLQQLTDRADLVDLTARLAQWLDGQRFDEAPRLFTPDIAVRTPGGSAEGLEAVVAQARRNHEGARTHHSITNVLPAVDGDRATIDANVLLAFVHSDGALESIGGRYRLHATRTGAGWRLYRLEVDQVWGGQGVNRAA